MRAIVLEDVGWLVERDVPDPVPGPGEVLVEVGACGVCRTDLQIFSGDLSLRRRPVVLGHQVAGRIAGTGERVGVAWLHAADGTCSACHTRMASMIARKLHEGESYTYCENCTRFLIAGEG